MNNLDRPLNNDIEPIVDILIKKSKKSFGNKKRTRNMVSSFSPGYRDFIYKIIRNSSLKIKTTCKDSCIYSNEDGEIFSTMLKTRKKNEIYFDPSREDSLPHELGHSVDFWFGKLNSLSKTVTISNNQTLFDIFTEEFNSKKEELYQLVMSEYKNIINSNINDKAYYIIMSNIDKYRMLTNIPINNKTRKTRKLIQKELYDSGFVETYYQLVTKNCYSILNSKYSPILDALSSNYDMSGLFLHYHENDYYQSSNKRPVQEFFANLIAAKVTSKHVYIDNLLKYLSKSFEAFEKLFVIFYDHIQNNKRFTDVKLKKVEN